MSSIIEVKNLSKKYRISSQRGGARYRTIRDDLADFFRKSLFWRAGVRKNEEDILALDGVNFSVEAGEILGVIGHNGAGKTTLLKVLTRITPPTAGEAVIRGRIGSLLEVGTGFHPELTGRENIYLNGAILGMTKREIDAKFDEIVGFSGVEKFLDTPIKRYSTGMSVRLAFSVAAHLDTDILLVDEVLAVGDAVFQKKSLDKMQEVTKEAGRTVILVSHNMAAVQELCKKCILLENGKVKMIGETKEVVEEYLKNKTNLSGIQLKDRKDRRGKGNIRFKEIRLAGSNNNNLNTYSIGDDIYVYLKIENSYSAEVPVTLSLSIRAANETGLISCDSELKGKTYRIPGASESVAVCKIYSPPLNYGDYYVNVSILHGNEPEDWITSAAKFSIEAGSFDNRITTNPFPVLSKFEWGIQ